VLTYPEIRGILAELEEEFRESAKTPGKESFSGKAIFVLAMVDRRLAARIKQKSEKTKNQKFFF
tara:strand:+ start:243 stop:434 length:192 start_codon:yes stop_codon:yes gene_type:complete